MRGFNYKSLINGTWDNEILSYVAQIHEYKGKQELYIRQKPVELDRLIEIAKVQSTEASNRIEGIVTTNARLKQLIADKTTPQNRDEKEILGYRNVLNHPFNDGNGRMSRLLTLLLLYRSGYMAGQYISIEKAIADTKESYYDALAAADRGWHTSENDPKPFIKYMLAVILFCYREFEDRINTVWKAGVKSTSYDIVKRYVLNKIGTFTKQEALAACPTLGSSSVESALKKLVADGTIAKMGAGRKTHYVRSDALQ